MQLNMLPHNGFFAFQRWSVADGVSDINPVHELGSCGGLAFEVPPGQRRTLVIAIGVYVKGVATTGLEGEYLYTRYYASLEHVLAQALERTPELRCRSAALDSKLLACGLSPAHPSNDSEQGVRRRRRDERWRR